MELAGPYCHRCGQHDFEFHRSFGHVFMEALENFFHFDSKLFHNTVTLLFRPGRLTAAFNAGRRASQMPPFRLYLFVSVLFFFLLFLEGAGPTPIGDRLLPVITTNGNGQPDQSLANPPERNAPEATTAETPADAPPKRNVDPLTQMAEQIRTDLERERAAKRGTEPESDAERWLTNFAHRAADPVHRREMLSHFLHSLPKLLLLCLPLFALYTRVLFRRSGLVYLQHLVLALHFHTFIYLWLMFRDGWGFLAGLPGWGIDPYVRSGLRLWMLVYPFVMLRHLFANSWPRTILKTGLLFGTYFFTLSVAMFVSAIVILLLL